MAIMSEIEVQVNGEPRHVAENLSVHDFLGSLDLNPALIVVERNGTILRRADYKDTKVEPGDTLELVHFVGGG